MGILQVTIKRDEDADTRVGVAGTCGPCDSRVLLKKVNSTGATPTAFCVRLLIEISEMT